MGEYAFVRDTSGNLMGIWLINSKMVDDQNLLEALFAKHDALNIKVITALDNKLYRIVKNIYDDKGGFFLMFGNAPAPGETG